MTRIPGVRRPSRSAGPPAGDPRAGDPPERDGRAGEAGPGVPGAPDGEAAEAAEDTAGAGRPPRRRLRRAVPAAGAAALVLAGCGFFHAAHELDSAPSARNRALTDAGATARVAGDVGSALARIFSYTPDGLGATERSARSVLAGRAERQYTELIGRIREDLVEQRVTLSTQAVRTGVIELNSDSARLLVFLDQISRRGKDGATAAAAQLTVTARWEEDRWRIVDIKTR
ncbi:nuclear transport factor 2 family protein [Streptomyces glaucosporus]|uniref:Nuclear transport factor 2 family protein n=1 Tax=Streptomyces glaucosporus TaxID=284044 RepID=A0ABN3I2C4_9ACTN